MTFPQNLAAPASAAAGIGRRPLLLALAAAALYAAVPSLARAEGFPDKPLRLVVPFPAGGAADMMARGMAQRLGSEPGTAGGR